MHGRFVDAFTLLPKQRVICGYTTKPLCLRHRIVLESIGSPFITGEREATPMDVVMAAKVFSSSKLIDLTEGGDKDKDAEHAAMMIVDTEYFKQQVNDISEFIKDQALWPEFWNKSSSGSNKDRGVPWVLSIIATLVSNGIEMEQAMTMPESQAVWLSTAFSIAEGSEIDLISSKDLASMEYLKALRAKEASNG